MLRYCALGAFSALSLAVLAFTLASPGSEKGRPGVPHKTKSAHKDAHKDAAREEKLLQEEIEQARRKYVAHDMDMNDFAKCCGGSPQPVTRLSLNKSTGVTHQMRNEDLAAMAHEVAGASFVAYHPSALEQRWIDNVAEWQTNPCTHLSKDESQLG